MFIADTESFVILAHRERATQATAATAAAVTFTALLQSVAYDSVVVIVRQMAASATNISAVMANLSLQHSSNGSTWTVVPGCEGTTGTPSATQFALTAYNNTLAPAAYVIKADTRGIGEQFRVVVQTPSAAANSAYDVLVLGFNGKRAAQTITDRNVQGFGIGTEIP